MGIIYNKNAVEQELYSAYGLTVYGRINRYEWTIHDKPDEDALISIRISDGEKDLFNYQLGNRCIFQSILDTTIDNFLWWIAMDKPDEYSIENQVFKSLCQSDSLFNHNISNRKLKLKRQEEERKRIEEAKAKELADIQRITEYGSKNGLIPRFTYDKTYLIKALTERAADMIRTAEDKSIEGLIGFMEQHPDNNDARIVFSGSLEEVLGYVG